MKMIANVLPALTHQQPRVLQHCAALRKERSRACEVTGSLSPRRNAGM